MRTLVSRAKRALGMPTTGATVEEALRRGADSAEDELRQQGEAQQRYFAQLDQHLDLTVLASDDMRR